MPSVLLFPRHRFILPRFPAELSSDEEGGGEEGGKEGSEEGGEEGGEERARIQRRTMFLLLRGRRRLHGSNEGQPS